LLFFVLGKDHNTIVSNDVAHHCFMVLAPKHEEDDDGVCVIVLFMAKD
jgi:hypothetical protein